MIQKFLYRKIFLKIVQNGPIRKVITMKVIFEDLFIFSPAVGHPGWTLRRFSEDFFKTNVGPFIEIVVSDRIDIAFSECF